MKLFVHSLVAVSVAGLAASAASGAVTYTFGNITANNVLDAATGEAQITVTVDAAGPGQASFRFDNAGPAACSITDIYFDDGTLLGIASITNSVGVDFEQGANPANLPGANMVNPAFEATAGFTADSNSPAQPNGVNPGEHVIIVFNLINGMTIDDVYEALDGGEDLRIGIHVQGFASGNSEGFINHMPAPGTAALLGLAGLVAGRRRRN